MTRFHASIPLVAVVVLTLATADRAAAGDRATIRGRIEKIDLATKRVTVQTVGGDDLTLMTDGQSKLTMKGEKTTLDEFRLGQRVRATYTKKGDINRVIALRTAVTTEADLGREVREALKAVGEYTHTQKEKYEEKMREVIDDVDDRIDDLEAQAKEASGEAREKLKGQIDTLKAKKNELQKRLDKAKPAAADAWDEFKSGVSAAAEDLGKALDEFRRDK